MKEHNFWDEVDYEITSVFGATDKVAVYSNRFGDIEIRKQTLGGLIPDKILSIPLDEVKALVTTMGYELQRSGVAYSDNPCYVGVLGVTPEEDSKPVKKTFKELMAPFILGFKNLYSHYFPNIHPIWFIVPLACMTIYNLFLTAPYLRPYRTFDTWIWQGLNIVISVYMFHLLYSVINHIFNELKVSNRTTLIHKN